MNEEEEKNCQNNEINSIPYESSPEQITTEDDGSTFINLQSIITSAQPELAPCTLSGTGLSTESETGTRPSIDIRPSTSTETPVTAVPKPKRKRRTKAQMAEFRVSRILFIISTFR